MNSNVEFASNEETERKKEVIYIKEFEILQRSFVFFFHTVFCLERFYI